MKPRVRKPLLPQLEAGERLGDLSELLLRGVYGYLSHFEGGVIIFVPSVQISTLKGAGGANVIEDS